MRPITANPITQGRHGDFEAVDYSAEPDPIAYAPEDVTFYAYILNAGACGNNLQAIGKTGRHGWCHVEESYIKPGQTIKKGKPLFKMGYNGKTIPEGPEGRHAHWVIHRAGGYVYPPSKITEPFGGSEEDDMHTGEFENKKQTKSAEDWYQRAVHYRERTIQEKKKVTELKEQLASTKKLSENRRQRILNAHKEVLRVIKALAVGSKK